MSEAGLGVQLDSTVTQTELKFASIFDNMPTLPRPLPKAYENISWRSMILEAKNAAPYKQTGEATDNSEPLVIRKLQRLRSWYLKSAEFRVIHQKCGSRNGLYLNITQGISILLTTGCTAAVFLFGSTEWVSLATGIAAAVVAAITSLTKYAR